MYPLVWCFVVYPVGKPFNNINQCYMDSNNDLLETLKLGIRLIIFILLANIMKQRCY